MKTIVRRTGAVLCLFSFFIVFSTHAFIKRHYEIEEIIGESTNIVFGTVSEVNRKRMTGVVKVEENVKGKSKFQKIRINIGAGQGKFPQQLIKKFKVGRPAVIFYKRDGQRLPSLGHIDGTWFQTFGKNRSDKSRVWWNFTHIEIYLHRTFEGSTPEFQRFLRQKLTGKDEFDSAEDAEAQRRSETSADSVRVFVLAESRANVEFKALTHFDKVANQKVTYQRAKKRDLSRLAQADILWIGQGEVCESEYRLTGRQERQIKTFVNNGGVVIVTGQDSDKDRACETGWLPFPLRGVERSGQRDFQPTDSAGSLFREPNPIESGDVFIDDTWTDWSREYTILATTNRGKEIAIAMLKYGKGMYLITGLQNETKDNLSVNKPMMENLVHFAVEWLSRR